MSIYGAVLEYVTGKSETEIPSSEKYIRSYNGYFYENELIDFKGNETTNYIQEE